MIYLTHKRRVKIYKDVALKATACGLIVGVFLAAWMYPITKPHFLIPHVLAYNFVVEDYGKGLPQTIKDQIKVSFIDKGQAVVDQALLVARCESGVREEAVNPKNKDGSHDSGVFQINSGHGIPNRYLLNSRVNIAIARQMYDAGGWNPWRSSNNCHHLLK